MVIVRRFVHHSFSTSFCKRFFRRFEPSKPSCRANLERPGIIGLLKCRGRNGQKKVPVILRSEEYTTWIHMICLAVSHFGDAFENCDGKQRLFFFNHTVPANTEVQCNSCVQTGKRKTIKKTVSCPELNVQVNQTSQIHSEYARHVSIFGQQFLVIHCWPWQWLAGREPTS